MITIQIDRVKYKPTPEQQNEFYMKFMEDIGTHKLVLEEVKENEDPVGDTIIKDMLDNAYKVTYAKDHSILEKLRWQIEYWIAEAESCADTPNIYNDYRAGVMREVLATIKSLEQSQTKEEPTYMESMGWKATPEWNILVPQFTPWQMIEVSNDKKKWHRKILEKIDVWEDFPFVTVPDEWVEDYYDDVWNFARQPQEDIELLPKFNREIVEERAMNSHAHQVITLAWISDILVEQVELLTNAVNQLIKAKKK